MPPTLSASYLRRLAEHADGLRGKGPHRVGRKSDNDLPEIGNFTEEKTLFEVYTKLYGEHDMTPPSSVEVSGKPVFPPNQTNNQPAVDSLFWTQSAVFKFLIPYYVPFLDPAHLEELKGFSANKDILAIGHRYPTDYDESPDKSGYMSVTAPKDASEPPELSEIVFVVGVPGGTARTVTWADYIKPPPALPLATPSPSEPAASDEPKKEP